MKVEMKGSTESAKAWEMLSNPSWMFVTRATAMEVKITGTKAMPPRRGTSPLWILRSLTSSKRLRRKAIRSICGIRKPARSTHKMNMHNKLIGQYPIIPELDKEY